MNCRLILPLILVCSFPVLAEEEEDTVYRTTDEQGRPVFSDQAGDGAQEVKVKKPMTFPAGSFADQYNRFTAPGGQPGEEGEAPPFAYSTLDITSPTQDESIRDNAGNLTITFSVQPSVQPGHSLQLMMDGQLVTQLRSSEPVSLENVDRGTHQVHLQVVDAESGTVLQQGTPVSFSLLRHSVLHNRGN